MLIDQVVSSLDPAAGGPSRTVPQLANALSKLDSTQVRLITQSRPGASIMATSGSSIEIKVGVGFSNFALRAGLPGRRMLQRSLSVKRPDLLHSNGIWHPLNHWASSAARYYSIPLVVQPRGMLEPWSLAWRSKKKRIGLSLYQRKDLHSCNMLIATAEQEADSLRKFGLQQPIAVIPNGIDIPSGIGYFSKRNRPLLERPRALFMGRIHPKKGLENLLRAWAIVDDKNWLLDIAGPDEGGYKEEIVALVKQLGIIHQVNFVGEVTDDIKWNLYREVELFILPSFSENFGVVVAEALSQGLPVISTTGTPWQDLKSFQCGWWVEPTRSGLVDALTEAFSLPLDNLRGMGERGSQYVRRYDWNDIAQQMLISYDWLLGKGTQPLFVHLD